MEGVLDLEVIDGDLHLNLVSVFVCGGLGGGGGGGGGGRGGNQRKDEFSWSVCTITTPPSILMQLPLHQYASIQYHRQLQLKQWQPGENPSFLVE